jgi:hypothetical protein
LYNTDIKRPCAKCLQIRKYTYFTWFVQNQHKGLTNHRKAHLIPRQVEHVDILDLLTVVMDKLAANLGKAVAWLQIKSVMIKQTDYLKCIKFKNSKILWRGSFSALRP